MCIYICMYIYVYIYIYICIYIPKLMKSESLFLTFTLLLRYVFHRCSGSSSSAMSEEPQQQ